jgi:hypothetical protein
MSYFADNARVKTAALLASTFLGQFYLIGLAAQFMGVAGDFLAEAVIQGSPLVWLVEPVLYLLGVRRGPASAVLLYLLVAAPYPILGWLIGYRWPLHDATLGGLARAVLLRFVLVWVPIVAIGLWLALSE